MGFAYCQEFLHVRVFECNAFDEKLAAIPLPLVKVDSAAIPVFAGARLKFSA